MKVNFGQVEQRISALEHNQVFDYLSRWGFESMLNSLASLMQEFFQKRLGVETGCTLLYRTSESEPRYVIGGSSGLRTKMDPSARFYLLDRLAHKRSFTAYSLRYGQPLALDEFEKSIEALASKISHQPKDCELLRGEQRSYLTIPAIQMDLLNARGRAALKCNAAELPKGRKLRDQKLPLGLLRLTFDRAGVATQALNLLLTEGARVLTRIFELLVKGRSVLDRQLDPGALAIADLNSNLLRFRDHEYLGLEALASHLQTLFPDQCECSIFRSHPVGDKIHLYLAATTALSNDPQHKKFRENFFKHRNHYTCERDPDPEVLAQACKTEKAFYLRGTPIREPSSQGKGGFPGRGEWTWSTSFLALAIPSRIPGGQPYGVIRLVRGSSAGTQQQTKPFTEDDERRAAAIAKTLSFWLEFFPRNDELLIKWESEELKLDTLRTLFTIHNNAELEEAEIEFHALAGKLFVNSFEVKIKKALGGYSGAAVLLVESDSERELILKCATKVGSNPADPISHTNSITAEVQNYGTFVEGRILNHNVIYPERVRETRQINGFVSSFVGKGLRRRRTVSELATSSLPPSELFTLLDAAVKQTVDEIGSWWYEHVESARSESARAFVKDALQQGDLLWHLSQNQLAALDDNVFDAANTLKYHLDEHQRPSVIWERFHQWSFTSGPIEWAKCINHGDLHGGNMFVDPQSGETWLIDFARTGPRLSTFDLATLEMYTKYQFLPTVLREQKVLTDRWEFIKSFMAAEEVLARQTSYNALCLPTIASDKCAALDALDSAVRVVTNIRTQLHNALKRDGRITDYLITLFLISFRYMNIRGASDADADNLRVVLSALGSANLLDTLIGQKKPA